jgi:hypothetical protein
MIEWGRAMQAIGHTKYHTTPKFYERTNFRKLGERMGGRGPRTATRSNSCGEDTDLVRRDLRPCQRPANRHGTSN